MRFLALILCLSSPAVAQDAMTGAEFDAYVTGRTLTFGTQGSAFYGIEQYLPDNRVIWSGGDGECTDGVWYESKGNICFRYVGDPQPKCWNVYADENGIRAVYATRPDTTILFESRDNAEPLVCGNLSS